MEIRFSDKILNKLKLKKKYAYVVILYDEIKIIWILGNRTKYEYIYHRESHSET